MLYLSRTAIQIGLSCMVVKCSAGSINISVCSMFISSNVSSIQNKQEGISKRKSIEKEKLDQIQKMFNRFQGETSKTHRRSVLKRTCKSMLKSKLLCQEKNEVRLTESKIIMISRYFWNEEVRVIHTVGSEEPLVIMSFQSFIRVLESRMRVDWQWMHLP